MKKNKIIVIGAVVVIIIGGLIGFGLIQAKKLKTSVAQNIEKVPEVFLFSGMVSSVDVGNNFLMVKPDNKTEDIKVVISEITDMSKTEIPFDPKNPPEGGTFTPIKTKMGISDFKVGDKIFIHSTKDINGKKEISDIDWIQI